MSTLLAMSQIEPLVPLQVPVRKEVRKRLRNCATNIEVTMGVLTDAFVDYCAGIMEGGGKLPPALTAAIERARAAERAKKARDGKKDSSHEED